MISVVEGKQAERNQTEQNTGRNRSVVYRVQWTQDRTLH